MKSKSSSIVIMKQKLTKENPTNHQKAAKTRRQRGYQWEDTIVKRFRKTKNWKAFRLDHRALHYLMCWP